MRKNEMCDIGNVLCPFYKWHERTRISCEGIDGDSDFGQEFRTRDVREKFMLEKCCEMYKACPIYGVLMEKKYPEAME